MRRTLVAAAVLALVLPGAAAAHATLKQGQPGLQSRVEAPPSEILLRFDQSVTIVPNAIIVLAGDGRVVSGAVSALEHDRVLRTPVSGLRRGEAYTVRWRALASDGHIGSGVFTFGVGVAAPPPTEAVGAGGLTWKDDAARWAYFAGLALLLGSLAFRLLVVRGPVEARVRRRLLLIATVGGFTVIDVGITAFVLRASNALQLPFVDLMYGDLSPFATSTRFGTAFVVTTLGFALATALVVLAWIFDRDVLLWPALALGAGFASGLSLSGHSATEPNATWLSQVADWAHLLAASVWAGGLLALVVCIWPLAPVLRRQAFLRFSRLATALVAVLVLAGTYLSIVRLPDLSDLWATAYGQTLLVKIGVVSLALAWGGAHHLLVRPRLERGADPGGRVGRSLLGESTVAMAVLLVAAVLVNASPPVAEDGSTAQTASAPR